MLTPTSRSLCRLPTEASRSASTGRSAASGMGIRATCSRLILYCRRGMVSGTLTWRRLCKMAVILFEWWPDSFASKLQRSRTARDVTLSRCASGSFAVMLQNGSVMMPGVISPTPSSSSSTRPTLRSRTKRSYHSRLSRQAAPCRNVSSRTHGTSCQPQCGHRGDILAADLEPRHAHTQELPALIPKGACGQYRLAMMPAVHLDCWSIQAGGAGDWCLRCSRFRFDVSCSRRVA